MAVAWLDYKIVYLSFEKVISERDLRPRDPVTERELLMELWSMVQLGHPGKIAHSHLF